MCAGRFLRRAFTMVELMVVVAIIGLMVTIGVRSITAGKAAVRIKGATRDIFGAIRHARSTALVTGQPAVVEYSTVTEDGEVMAKVEIVSAKLFDQPVDRSRMQTLSGEPLKEEGRELVHIEGSEAESFSKSKSKSGSKSDSKATASADGKEGDAAQEGGETMEEILFAPVNAEVVKGMRLKVLKGDEELAVDTGRKMRISVFSNVDYISGRYKDAKAKQKEKEQAERGAAEPADGSPSAVEDQEPVSVVWETNGRVEPHKVWVYADGQKPEDGLMIRIDRFGAAKVLPGDGREED